ncbi:MAG: hypothetical protein M1364_00535 [Candidatus Marsarchaeota archaeon]|jgi:hypothetical protein|nr:hypothetical protein [Candidatus Marsarchaeota archaeon]
MYSKDKRKINFTLRSSICVKAILKTTFKDVIWVLSFIPGFILISSGTRLRYKIIAKGEINYDLILGKDQIEFSYYFSVPTEKNKALKFRYFVIILAYLKDAYEMKLESLYPYIVDIVQGNNQLTGAQSNADKSINLKLFELNNSNFSLSNSIINLLKENTALKRENAIYLAFFKKFFKIYDYSETNAVELMSNQFNLDKDTISYIKERVSNAEIQDK